MASQLIIIGELDLVVAGLQTLTQPTSLTYPILFIDKVELRRLQKDYNLVTIVISTGLASYNKRK